MDSSTLRKGSDCIDENDCQLCSVAGNSVAAKSFCVDCDAYLCKKCCSHHKSLKRAKKHALVKLDKAKMVAPKKPGQDKCAEKCSLHPAITVNYYCVAHSHLGCSICFSVDHKRCKDIEHIPTAVADLNRHTEFKKFDEDLHTLSTAYKSGLTDIKTDLAHLQTDEHQMRKAYTDYRKGVIDGLDKLEREIFSQAKDIRDKETRNLETLSRNLEQSKANVDNLIQKLDLLLASGKRCDAYVLAKTNDNLLTALQEALVKVTDAKTYERYGFNGNMDVTKAGTLGKLTTRHESVSPSTAWLARRDTPDGPAMAKLIMKGVRVRRGRDWKKRYANEDGGAGTLGTVTGPDGLGRWYVQWDRGNTPGRRSYRMGKHNAYDLEIVQ